MPALQLPAPILYIASEPSFFGVLSGDSKNPTLRDVTRIDFPLIEKGQFQPENLAHALKSLEQTSLYVVVSDEIFFHHISDYAISAQKDIENEIKETVATVFSDKKEPLHIVTVDLAKTSKMQTVQITALTKSNLATLTEAAKEAGVEILSILPASFVVKAFVSVDPSLFVLVTSNSFLLTSHYIGVDFALNIGKDNVKELISTVRTLKKERPHIQHVYLCGDPDVILPLHEELTEVLPVQDVEVKEIDTEHDTPFFLRAFILGVKEVIENDFPLPHFSTDQIHHSVANAIKAEIEDPIKTLKNEMEKDNTPTHEEEADKEEDIKTIEKEEKQPEENLTEKEEEIETKEPAVIEKVMKEEEPPTLAIEPPVKVLPVIAATTVTPTLVLPTPTHTPSINISATAETVKPISSITPPIIIRVEPPKTVTTPKVTLPDTTVIQSQTASSVKTEAQTEKIITVASPAQEIKTETVVERTVSMPAKKKEKSNIFKYLMLTIGVAVLISLVGGGIVISQQALSDKKNPPLQTPISEVSPTPVEEVTPTPEPTAVPVDLKKLSFGVFNATSIAGRAGKIATDVKKAGATKVDAGNAKDKYDAGNFIMFAKPEFQDAKATLEKATGLTLEEKPMSDKENPNSKYDVIIIINE